MSRYLEILSRLVYNISNHAILVFFPMTQVIHRIFQALLNRFNTIQKPAHLILSSLYGRLVNQPASGTRRPGTSTPNRASFLLTSAKMFNNSKGKTYCCHLSIKAFPKYLWPISWEKRKRKERKKMTTLNEN